MMKRSLFWVLILVLAAGLVFTACGQKEEPKTAEKGDGSWERVQEAGKIVAGLDDAYPPMGFRDENNELVGFDIDMAKEISKRIGVEIEWMPTEWNGIVPSLQSKKFDVIISGMNMLDKRKEVVNFAGPYGVAGQVILTKVENENTIATLADLKGIMIGTQLGSTGEEECRKAGFDEKTNMKLYDKFPLAFADLDAGRIEAVVIDGFTANEWINTGKYKKVGEDIGVGPEAAIGIAVRQDDVELLNKLNEAIDSMLEDGTLKEISLKWAGYDITEGITK